MVEKPYSQSSENNKEPILGVLKNAFKNASFVLEIGSGTGQHAVYFAAGLPHLVWQPTDLPDNIPGIKMWVDEAGLPNLKNPIVLNVADALWPVEKADGVFTANTLHIMSKPRVGCFFDGVEVVMRGGGTLCIYGPFNYGGGYTSDSNKKFDEWLKGRDPESGIKDFEWVNSLAERAGLELVKDHEMPVNNRLLEWRKTP
ncbi:MAG: methylase [Anaerolineaceae bacterium]|nr:methylase [Anaerolineaceae bacterium]